MMRMFLAVIGGLVGAAIGAGVGLLLGTLAAEVFQVSSFEGGAGYFAVFLFGLPGMLLGLVAGIVLPLRWRSGHARPEERAPDAATGQTLGRFAVVLAVIAAIVAGGIWLYAEVMDDSIAGSNQADPRLSYEVRLPPGTALPEHRRGMSVRLFTGSYEAFGDLDDNWRRQDGDRPMVTGWFDLHFKTSSRLLSVTVGEGPSAANPAWVFKLPLGRTPGHMDAFSPWYPVDFIDDGSAANPRKATAADQAEVRYRLVFAGRE